MEALPYLARAVVVLRDHTRGRIAPRATGLRRFRTSPLPADLARIREALRRSRGSILAGGRDRGLPAGERVCAGPRRGGSRRARRVDLGRARFACSMRSTSSGAQRWAGSRAQGFCDESGRAFEARGLYVADAAALPSNTGANPQITIMANALRVAAGIAEERRV